jgi:hypothetical protein
MEIKSNEDLVNLITKEMKRQGLNPYRLSQKTWVKQPAIGRFLNARGNMSVQTETIFAILAAMGVRLYVHSVEGTEKLCELASIYNEEMVQELIAQSGKLTKELRAEFIQKSIKRAQKVLEKE